MAIIPKFTDLGSPKPSARLLDTGYGWSGFDSERPQQQQPAFAACLFGKFFLFPKHTYYNANRGGHIYPKDCRRQQFE